MSFSTPPLGASRQGSDNGFALYPHSLMVGAQQHPPLASNAPRTPPTPESESATDVVDHDQVDIDLVESPWNTTTTSALTMPSSTSPPSVDATAKSCGKGGSKTKMFAAQVKKLFTSSSDRERDKERQRLRQLSISSPTLIHSTSLAVQPPPNPLSRSTSRSSTATNRSRSRSIASPQSPHTSSAMAYPSPTSSASSGAEHSPAADQSSFALPPEGVPPVPEVDPTLRARAQSLPAPSKLPPELMAAAAIADADRYYLAATLPDPAVLGMSWQSQSSLSTALGNASVVSLPNLSSSPSRMQSPMMQPTLLASRRRRDSDMVLSSSSSRPTITVSQDSDDWLPPTGVTKKLTLTPKVIADSSSSIASSSSSSKSLPPPPPPLAPPRIPIWAQFQNQSSAPPGPLSPVSQAVILSSIDDYRATPVPSSNASTGSVASSPASSTRGLAFSSSSIQSTPAPSLPDKSPAPSIRSLFSPDPAASVQPQHPNDLLIKAPVPATDTMDLLRLESLITATVDSERRVLQHLRKQSLSGASSPTAPAPADLTSTPPSGSQPPPTESSDLDRRLAKMQEFERLISSSASAVASPVLSSRSLASTSLTPTLSTVSLTQFPGARAEGDQMVALAALHRVQMDKYPVPACELSSSSESALDVGLASDDDELDEAEAEQIQQRVIARHPSLAHIFAPLMDVPSTSTLRDPRALAAEEIEAAARAATGAKSKGVKGWWSGNRTKLLGTLKHVLRDAQGANRSGDSAGVPPDAKQDLVQFAKHVIRRTSATTLTESGGTGVSSKRQSVKRRTVNKAEVSGPIMEEGDEMDVINMYAMGGVEFDGVNHDCGPRRSLAKGGRVNARLPVDSVVEKDDELVELVRQIDALMAAENALAYRVE